ncbi:unnamed protein product, partial [Brassica oleracea var. botrytis]
FGHSARRCTQLQSSGQLQAHPNQMQYQPRANLATSYPYNSSPWLLDSGATHHLTSDLSNLALHQPYQGGDEVAIADGSGLQISHIGEGSQH